MTPPPNTDHALMDSEHRAVLDWAQEGAKRLREARPTEESLYAVDVLVHLARSHFENEQVEMRERGYPDWVVHRQDHERLLAELAQLRQAIVEEAAGAEAPRDAPRMSDWLCGCMRISPAMTGATRIGCASTDQTQWAP